MNASNTPGGNYHPFGTDVPIVLVHGWDGKNSHQWGELIRPTDFISRLDNVDRVSVAAEFQYDVSGLVLDTSFKDHVKPLAYTIDCMAEISRQNGGAGKVIVVGYSEGAAIARKALNKTVNGHFVTDEVGQVVTIADASHYYPGPGISGTVMVHAIAGDVLVQKYDKSGNPSDLNDKNSDDTIRTSWATWQYSENTSQGGGSTIIKCTETKGGGKSQIPPSDISCHHGVLLGNGRVQEDAIAAIARYIAFLNPTPASGPYHTWTRNGLTLRLPDAQWGEVMSPLGDQAIDGTTDELGTERYLLFMPYSEFCTTNPTPSCTFNPNFVLTGPAPVVSIGGRTPDVSASYIETTQTSTDVWCFSSEGICVFYRNGPTTNQLQPSQAVLDVFASATWA